MNNPFYLGRRNNLMCVFETSNRMKLMEGNQTGNACNIKGQ